MSSSTIADLESTYFAQRRPRWAMIRISAFRSFSEYLGFPRKDWQRAFERVFRMDGATGNQHLKGFRAWQLDHGLSSITSQQRLYQVRSFFGYAHRRGVLAWKPGHKKHELSATLWAQCTRTFQRALKEWLESLENRNYSPGTIRSYRNDLLRLGRYLAERHIRGVAVPMEVLGDWIKELHSQKRKPITANAYARSSRSFFTWLVDRGKIPLNPLHDFRIPKAPNLLPRSVSEGQILKLLRAATNRRDRAILEMLYASGCRASEATSLDLSDISFRARTARCVGKNRRERLLLLNHAAVRAIRAYLPERSQILKRPGGATEQALFLNARGFRLRPSGVSQQIGKIVKSARFKVPITAHVIRHSMATHLLNRGADLEVIKDLLGHTNIASTLIYAQLSRPRMRSAFLKAQPRIRPARDHRCSPLD